MENGKRRPTAEKVIARLKDDGDFDSLRVKIIRKVKENVYELQLVIIELLGIGTVAKTGHSLKSKEELRNSIVSEVKQSMVLSEEGSEKLKQRQLSDAIYEELEGRIMAQISDEVWMVIRSCENDIRGTVESVYHRIVNPEAKKRDNSSPNKELLADGKENHFFLLTPSTSVINVSIEMEIPPGFGSTDAQSNKSELTLTQHDEQPQLSNEDSNHQEEVTGDPHGFGPPVNSATLLGGASDEDPDLPPGFG